MNYTDKSTKKNYSINAIGEQLAKLRYHFRYTQVDMANLVNVTNQYWGRIEKGTVFLHISKLVQLANIFDIDLNYFFITDAAVNDYLLSSLNQQIEMLTKKTRNLKPTLNTPFIETSIFKQILSIFNDIQSNRITLLQTVSGNGTTTAIKRISTTIKQNVIIIDSMQIMQKLLNDIQNLHNTQTLQHYAFIIEDVENYPIGDIIDFFNYRNVKIMVTCRQKEYFEQYFSQFSFVTYDLLGIAFEDILLFFKTYIPGFLILPEKQFKLELKIKGSIKILMTIITKIKNNEYSIEELLTENTRITV